MSEYPERVSIAELAKLAGVSKATVFRRIRLGAIGFPKPRKDCGFTFFNGDEVREYLANGCKNVSSASVTSVEGISE